MTANKKIARLYHEACVLSTQAVEKMARQILAKHPTLDEFVMAMGSAYFTTKAKTVSTQDGGKMCDMIYLDERAYMSKLGEFITEWDDALGITGTPMRFTATSPITENW